VRTPSNLPVAPGRREVPNALRHQQALDAADVLAALDHEPGPLTRAAACVFLLGAGHMHDPTNLCFAALQRHQRAQKPGRIQPIGFGPPSPAVDQQAGCVENPVLDPARAQPAVQPKAVVASLEAARDPHGSPQTRGRLLALARDQAQQAIDVTPVQPMLAHLVHNR
jgi:hypothetical protein